MRCRAALVFPTVKLDSKFLVFKYSEIKPALKLSPAPVVLLVTSGSEATCVNEISPLKARAAQLPCWPNVATAMDSG